MVRSPVPTRSSGVLDDHNRPPPRGLSAAEESRHAGILEVSPRGRRAVWALPVAGLSPCGRVHLTIPNLGATSMTTPTLHFPYPVVGPPRPRPPTRTPPAENYKPFLMHPPYDRMEFHSGWDALENLHTVPGTVAGLRLASPTDWPSLHPAVRQLRGRLPAASVVLVLPGGSPGDLLLSARASRGGVRAVLVDDGPLLESLRTALTCPDSLADDVVEWLYLRRLRLSPMVASLLREIFTHASVAPDLTTLLSRVGMAESSARFRLHKRLLPTPSRWFQAARALHAVLRIQARPRTPLLQIALEFGYADHSALSPLVHRAFRLRPGAVRGTLGWEWLMHRWVSTLPEAARAARPA